MGRLVITYDSPFRRLCLLLLAISAPFWALICPFGVLISIMSAVFGEFGMVSELGQAGFYLLGLIMGYNLATILRDKRIIITEDELSLPRYMALGNKGNGDIYWQDIERVDVIGNPADLSSVHLDIKIKGGGKIKLSLAHLATDDVDTLVLSMANWLSPGALSGELDNLRATLWTLTDTSFTRLWEDELSSRFSATAYQPLNPGHKLQDGNIKVLRQLAFGGWSAVYLVQEAQSKMKVLKESTLPQAASEELKSKARAMFKREAEILMRLHHRQIVQVYDYFEEDDRQYLLLEHIGGVTLRNLVKENGLHELDVRDYLLQICDILEYLHGLEPPLVHRDISPDNLVADGEKIVLIDFGAANEMLGTATGTLIGKQSYMPPEQFKGKATIQSDYYSLGATAYFLLTGKDPEPLSSNSPRKAGAFVSEEMNSLIEDLTNQDPAARPADTAEIKGRLVQSKRIAAEKTA